MKESKLLYSMMDTICNGRECPDCPLNNECVSMARVIEELYTDDEKQRIIDAYVKLYPDGSLLEYLAADISVTENEITNILE